MPRTIKTFHELYSSVNKKFAISYMNEYNSTIIDLRGFTFEQALNQITISDRQFHVAHMVYYFDLDDFTSSELETFFAKSKEILSKSNKVSFLTNCVSKDNLFNSSIMIKVFRGKEEFDLSLIDAFEGTHTHYNVMFTNNFLEKSSDSTIKSQTKTCDILLDRIFEQNNTQVNVHTFKKDFSRIDDQLIGDVNKFVGELNDKVEGLIDKFSVVYDSSIELI